MTYANSGSQVVRSYCRGCHGSCGVLVHVADGRVTKIEGDPECPTNRGTLCSRGPASLQLLYHPDRIKSPLKRTGPRGAGQWQRISWDEALDTIVGKLKETKQQYGAEAIVVCQGTSRDFEDFMYRFANLLETPNVLTPGNECYVSRLGACIVTCGNMPVCDYERDPACVVMWGNNVLWTNHDEYNAESVFRALSRDTKLIVVDPRLTYMASRADIWLQLRPGTDTALAFGLLYVIIEENLYDRDFVEKYVYGWDEFVERVREYPLAKVAEITWVPEEKIRQAARLYAQTKPACMHWGVPIEQGINCTDNDRILVDLMAITGNLDVPGGNVFFVPPPVRTLSDFALHRELPEEQRAKRLGADTFKLAGRVTISVPKAVWDAILTEKPYPVKTMLIHGSNPVITKANAREAYQALSQLDFLSVADLFLTPTAELADIFLPAATWLEMDHVADCLKRQGYVFARQKIVQVGECWSDYKIFNELGKRMAQGDYWWEDVEGGLDHILEPSGLTWREFKEKGYLQGKMEYRKYERKGFSTPTRKFELRSTTMEEWGYDPLPRYREVPESPLSQPELAREYPFILTAGARSPMFFHTEHRMIPWLREIHPDPIVEIHPEAAKEHGIADGDWVFIETPRGRIKQKARVTLGIDPRVVAAEHGWWFPEIKDPGHGWQEANINIVTDNDPAGYDPAMGSANLRALLCKIYRAPE